MGLGEFGNKAVMWLTKAAEQGHREAKIRLEQVLNDRKKCEDYNEKHGV